MILEWLVLVAVLLTVWLIGNWNGWRITWKRRGGRFNWRVFLGPWAYDRWWHEANERW
jgi:hypothetical protein